MPRRIKGGFTVTVIVDAAACIRAVALLVLCHSAPGLAAGLIRTLRLVGFGP